MRISLLVALALAACGQGSDAAQSEPRTIKPAEFLSKAVSEGLQEDGVDKGFVRECIAQKGDLFVLKCRICDSVRNGFSAYISTKCGQTPVPAEGRGIPKDIVDELKQGARLARLNALERLVDRYVSRHYERLRITAEERRTLHATLEEWKKEGMKMKEAGSPNFGDFCPSCNGAAKPR